MFLRVYVEMYVLIYIFVKMYIFVNMYILTVEICNAVCVFDFDFFNFKRLSTNNILGTENNIIYIY